jgi:hypothetical protein
MASRKEQKEQLRAEREERERLEKAAAARRARLTRIGGGAAVLVIAAVIIGIVASGGGNDKSSPAAVADSLQATPGPWQPLTAGLQNRSDALKLPAPSDSIYHVHAQLKVYVDGKQLPVPADVGIDPAKGFLASLHTHDAKGIIHMEAVEVYPFTLGEFMDIWGVKYTPTQLGAFRPGKGLVLETYINGQKVADGPAAKLKQGDRIVIGFGKPGSFPKDFKLDPSVT